MRKLEGMHIRRWGSILMIALIAVFGAAACTEAENLDKSRSDAVTARERNFDRAEAMWPAPTNLSNFPIRRALVEFTERQDLINHPWYIYIMGLDGSQIGYFVGQTYPINACNFLSSSERFVDTGNTEQVVTAPSYDGIFYGGGGSQAGCNSYFFFDVETNAMITFTADLWTASDQPLSFDTRVIEAGNTYVQDVPSDANGTPTP